VKFIREHKESPFFLYLPHNMPHVPLFRSPEFAGKSDVVCSAMWSRSLIGVLVECSIRCASCNSTKKTLVFFTSDNGPWLIFDGQGGSAGLLRDGKGSTWEGGMREPTLAWWPGQIKPGSVSRDLASTMDIFATLHALAGIDMPADRVLDSHDLTPVLRGTGPSTREVMFYYRAYQLMAVRKGLWKMHLMTQDAYGPGSSEPRKHEPPLLFNLDHDPGEKLNVADKNDAVIQMLQAEIAVHHATLEAAPSQLDL